MAYRLITQKDVDKHPEWASMGKSVNQMHDFPEDEQGNEIEDEDDVAVKKAKPEKPVSESYRSMREEPEAPKAAEKPAAKAEKPAAKAEKPVTKNDRVDPKKKGK